MQQDLQKIKEAAQGLLFMSETDHPFEIVAFKSGDVEKEMRQLTGKADNVVVEKQTVDYFLRNMVKVYPSYSDDQRSVAQRFLKLQELLKQKLKDVQVFRIGSIQIDVFIIGKLRDGSFGGLRTKVVET